MSNYILNPTQTSVTVQLPSDKASEVIYYEIHLKVWQDRYWMVSESVEFNSNNFC